MSESGRQKYSAWPRNR